MNAQTHSITWQRRQAGESPTLIRNGLEERFSGSMAELVKSTSAVTLLTRDGAEVQVQVRHALGSDSWEGTIVRVAPTNSSLKLGATVSFEASHVQSGSV